MLILVKSVWHWLRVFIDKCAHVCRWVKTVNRVFRPNVKSAVHLQSLFRDADWHKFASDILNRGKYPSVQVPNIVKDFLLSFSHRLWILLAIRNAEMGPNLITVFGQLQLYDSTLGRWGEALEQSEPNCRTLTHKHLWISKNIFLHVQSEHSPNSFLVYAVSLILIFDYKWSGLLTFLTAVHSLVVFLILCSLWRSKKSEDK